MSDSCDPMDCSLPVSSVHGILQERILERVAISFSRELFQPRDWNCISCIGRQILYQWATRETITNIVYFLSLYFIFKLQYLFPTSHLRLATFQVFHDHIWLVATVLDIIPLAADDGGPGTFCWDLKDEEVRKREKSTCYKKKE